MSPRAVDKRARPGNEGGGLVATRIPEPAADLAGMVDAEPADLAAGNGLATDKEPVPAETA
jgi:hypothetical protein